MKPQPLTYASSDTARPRRRWPLRLAIAIVLLLAIVALLPQVTVCQTPTHMDAVTGSMTRQTVWLMGFTVRPTADVSALELRLRRMNAAWKPDWRSLHNTHYNLLGGVMGYECGSAPPIYQLSQPELELLVAASTDEELLQFVHTMETGSEAEQRAAVSAAAEKAFQIPATTQELR